MHTAVRTLPGIVLAWSSVADGDMRIDALPAHARNRERFARSLGILPDTLVGADLVHGDTVRAVGKHEGGTVIAGTDALMTDEEDVFLSVTVADCIPVFLVHPERRALALVHAGWRGLALDIPGAAVAALGKMYGADARGLYALVGPSICAKHYAVGEEVALRFASFPGAITAHEDGKHANLRLIARALLLRAGVPEGNIETVAACTYEEPERFFSLRRDGVRPPPVIMAVLGKRDVGA
ncbi:MAG: laccase domain-containing protein [Patescibacteria group bacterium]|nr:laccase domain-containing protein [Patescibacteria group bacterium]